MPTNRKVKRIRWMAALTLILLFMSLLTPFFLRLLPPTLPGAMPMFETLSTKWKGAIDLIFLLLVCLFNACFFVFFVRLFRGLGRGKIFVPGNARWLYAGAWLPVTSIIFRFAYTCLISGGSNLALTALVAQALYNLALFSGIMLMALLYDVATDVSEENRLTV